MHAYSHLYIEYGNLDGIKLYINAAKIYSHMTSNEKKNKINYFYSNEKQQTK